MARVFEVFQIDKYLHDLSQILGVEALNERVADFTRKKFVQGLI
jgi:hypothetical protein